MLPGRGWLGLTTTQREPLGHDAGLGVLMLAGHLGHPLDQHTLARGPRGVGSPHGPGGARGGAPGGQGHPPPPATRIAGTRYAVVLGTILLYLPTVYYQYAGENTRRHRR